MKYKFYIEYKFNLIYCCSNCKPCNNKINCTQVLIC